MQLRKTTYIRKCMKYQGRIQDLGMRVLKLINNSLNTCQVMQPQNKASYQQLYIVLTSYLTFLLPKSTIYGKLKCFISITQKFVGLGTHLTNGTWFGGRAGGVLEHPKHPPLNTLLSIMSSQQCSPCLCRDDPKTNSNESIYTMILSLPGKILISTSKCLYRADYI